MTAVAFVVADLVGLGAGLEVVTASVSTTTAIVVVVASGWLVLVVVEVVADVAGTIVVPAIGNESAAHDAAKKRAPTAIATGPRFRHDIQASVGVLSGFACHRTGPVRSTAVRGRVVAARRPRPLG